MRALIDEFLLSECSAYVQFHKGNYPQAYLDFFEAFASYQAASETAKCLAYTVLISVLAKAPPVVSRAAAALKGHRLAHEALKLVDAYCTGGYPRMKECFEACDETMREDEFARQVLGAIRRSLVYVYKSNSSKR